MVIQRKIDQVKSIINTLQKNPNFALVKFDNTNHQTLESLRKDLRKNGAQFTVVKNTLLEKAINKLSSFNKAYLEFAQKFFPLKDKTALLVFKNDWSEGLKIFYQFITKEKTLGFKFAFIDKQTYEEAEMIKIAQLPSRTQLIASIAAGMKNPVNSLIYDLKFNLNKLVYILQQKSKQEQA